MTGTATHVVALRVETTGPNVAHDRIFEIAGALWRVGDLQPTATYCDPLSTDAVDRSVPSNSGSTDLCVERRALAPLDASAAADRLVEWLRQCDATVSAGGGRLLLLTDAVGCDAMFLNHLLARWSTRAPSLATVFGAHRPLCCVASFCAGLAGAPHAPDAVAAALRALGVARLPAWVERCESRELVAAATAAFVFACLE